MNATHTDLLRFLRSMKAKQATAAFSDQQLLQTFLSQHSEASFTALVQRHGTMVFGVCRRLLRHTQDAEDAFQATFLALARQAGSIRRQRALGSWLHGVAHRIAEKMKRTAARRAAHELRIDPQPPGDALNDITWRELRSVLDEELGKLPEKYRAPLVLCYLEARTQDEAARHLGWSKNTFGRRLNQARQLLARRLTRRGLTLPAVLTAPLLIDGTAQAALPPLLVAGTVRAALASAAGQATGALVSAKVTALAEGGAASLLVKKTSISFVLLLAVMLGAGGLLAHRAVHSRTFVEGPAAAPQSQTARSASKDMAIEIKGCVLDPDGKPLAGARLFLLSAAHQKKTDKLVRGTTDKDGRFRFQAQPSDFNAEGKATLAAVVNELGPDWIEITAEIKADIALRLVKDDVPIEGRVLDLEGRPIPGVRIQVGSLWRGDLDAWLKAVLARRYSQLPEHIGPEILGASTSAVSGKDGRFRLTGFGRDRVVYVRVRGENVEASDFDVVTRPNLPAGLAKGNSGTYPARFDHLAGPSKSIVGTVRDKRTGKPLAGISVTCACQTGSWLWATTDEQGRYRITSVGKREQYTVAAGGPPYFDCTKHDVADTPGLEPIPVDFALERGISMHGKLLDKVTGRPIRGEVHYIRQADNPYLKDFTDTNNLGGALVSSHETKADGSFTVAVPPGPGLLVALANNRGRYLTVTPPEPKPFFPFVLEGYHAIVRVEPSEKGPQSTTQNLYLEPAQTVNGTVVGPDGKPQAGAHHAGLTGTMKPGFPVPMMETASFTAGGISPKRTRNIVFFHAEKKLAKIQGIGSDTANPLTVHLEPLVAIRGRILDAADRPRAGVKLTIEYSAQKSDYQDLPLELLHLTPQWSKFLNRKATTDAEGRFHAEELVPGLKYFLFEGHEPGTFLEPLARGIAVESGKTKDLGDLKSK